MSAPQSFNVRWLIVRHPVLWWRRLMYRWTKVPWGEGSPAYPEALGGDLIGRDGEMP